MGTSRRKYPENPTKRMGTNSPTLQSKCHGYFSRKNVWKDRRK